MTQLAEHRTTPWRLPLQSPVGGRTEREGWHTHLVSMTGVEGIGEHAPWSPSPPAPCPIMLGAPVSLSTGDSAWDMAALDLISRERGVPAAAALCETPADRVAAHALVHDVASAVAAVADGFTLLKLKIGNLVPEELRRVELIAAAVPDAYLRLDVNGQWDPWDAHSYVRQLASPQIDWIEQPTAKPMDLRDLGVRIAWDESLRSEDWACALRVGDVAVIKPSWHGGPVTARIAGEAALSAGLDVCVTSVLGSAVDRWCALHTALSLHGEVSVGLAGPADAHIPEAERGFFTLPTTPGVCP